MSRPTELVAGRELDARVAQEVFGREVIRYGDGVNDWMLRSSHNHTEGIPRYSADFGAAATVLEKIRTETRYWHLDDCGMGGWTARITEWRSLYSDAKEIASAHAETLPEAICLAALKAIGAPPDQREKKQ